MSEFTLAKYLHNEANENKQLQQLMHRAAQLIQENEQLTEAESVSAANKFRLRMDIYSMEIIHEQRRSEHLAQCDALTEARKAYSSHLALSEQLKRIDLQKVMGYELQNQQQQWHKDLQEMESDYQKQRQRHEQMESRGIVQQFRRQQQQHVAAKAEVEKARNYVATVKRDIVRKLEAVKTERNELLVNLIEGGKELQAMRTELQSYKERETLLRKKTELSQKLQELQNTPTSVIDAASVMQKPFAATGFNSFTPLNFFKTFTFEPPQFPTFFGFLNTLPNRQESELLQKSALQQDEGNASLRSILRKEKTNTEESFIWPTTQKRVHFDMPSSGSSHGSSSPRTTATDDDTQRASPMASDDMKLPAPVVEHEAAHLSVQIQAKEMSSPEFETLSDEEMQTVAVGKETEFIHPQVATKETTVNVVAKKAEKSQIEIQECRIVKPAGTPLPKVLPIVLSPEDVPTQSSSKQKSNPYSFFDEMLKCSAVEETFSLSEMDEDSTSIDDVKQHSMQAGNAVPNASKITKNNPFENFLLMNVNNGQAEELEETMSQFPDAEVMNFNSDMMDCRNAESDEQFSFDLSDVESQNPNTENFL